MNNTTIYVCPHCERKYELGKTGTVEGCDECLKIIRDSDGMIIDLEPFFEYDDPKTFHFDTGRKQ